MRYVFSFILLLSIFSYSKGFSQEVNDYPFVLNRYNSIRKNLHAEAKLTYNCLQETLVLTRSYSDFEPVIKKGEPFYSYNIQLAYKRFGFEMGRYVKYYPSGGIYVKGWRSDGGMIPGYDLNQVVIKEYSENYALFSWVPVQEKVLDFGICMDTKFMIRFVISKQFKRLSYLLNINYLGYFISGMGLSIAYSPFKNLSIFEEFTFQGSFGSDNNPGYINVLGIYAKVNQYINMVLFYHYFYDDVSHTVIVYDRRDHRFGFEIKLIY